MNDPIIQALQNAVATIQALGDGAQANIDGANAVIGQQQAIVSANTPVVSEAAKAAADVQAEIDAIIAAQTPTPAAGAAIKPDTIISAA